MSRYRPAMVIRRNPDDFRVEEELTEAWQAKRHGSGPLRGPHALWQLEKVGLTTPVAAARLARALGLDPRKVSWAGLKDKHARTVQHLTLLSDPGARELPEAVEAAGLRARRIGSSDRPIRASAIARNRFEVVVRDLEIAASRRMDGQAQRLRGNAADQDPSVLYMVNYFGAQRFAGTPGPGAFLAQALVRGDLDTALRLAVAGSSRRKEGQRRRSGRRIDALWGRWSELLHELPDGPERQVLALLEQGGDAGRGLLAWPRRELTFALEAWQSMLWNDLARRICERRLADAPELGPRGRIDADEVQGPLVFPVARAWTPELLALELPFHSPSACFPAPVADLAARVLLDLGLSAADLVLPEFLGLRFGDASRPLVVAVEGFRMEAARAEPGGPRNRLHRRLSFSLPRGAYATILLRALGQ